MAILSEYMESHDVTQKNAFELIDEIFTTIELFKIYMGGVTTQIEQIEQSIYAHTRYNNNTYLNDLEDNVDIPRLDDNSNSVSSRSDS